MSQSRTRRRARETDCDLDARIEAFDAMSYEELAVAYLELFGVRSRTRNVVHLRKRLKWRVQELVEGGLPERARRKLAELGDWVPASWSGPLSTEDETREIGGSDGRA